MGSLIALILNVLHALVVAIPEMVKAFVDIRKALRDTVRVGRKHVSRSVRVGKRKYRVQRNRYERAKARRR